MDQMLFASDLDNTLLFSYKHRRETDRCVEHLEGREQGFFTQRSLELLAQVREQAWFVPVTTRSVEQYRRIAWPEGCAPQYAVTTNGGILLADGQMDPEWSAWTEKLAAPWREELLELQGRIEGVPIPKRCRMVDHRYLFAACDSREDAEALGCRFSGETALDVAVSGRKIYFFPPSINKGEAVRRLQERFRPSRTVCAGDSVIDVPMLLAAGVAIVPDRGLLPAHDGKMVCFPENGGRFPDFVLETVLREMKG